MKRFYLFLIGLIAAVGVLRATVHFDSDTKYRLECKSVGQGALALGVNHGSTAYLYYLTFMQDAEDAWWYIRPAEYGFTISNAQSGEYITYNSKRVPGVAKGLVLSKAPEGEKSQWKFEEMNGFLVIKSVSNPEQWFNLRNDNTWLMGTYPGSGTANELFTVYDESGNKVDPSGKDPVQPNQISKFRTAVDSLRLNGKQLVFDHYNQVYFIPANPSLRQGGSWETTFSYKLKTKYRNHTILLDDMEIAPTGSLVVFDKVDCGKPHELKLVNDKGEVQASAPFQFTFLPIVEINVSSCNGRQYTQGNIRVTDPISYGYDSVFVAAFKYRGASAQRYPKKSFAVKLRDTKGNAVDRSFLGMRSDNHWILDAMAVDQACMRNRVSTDLWNDFSVPPYYKDRESKARTGTRGHFVEVILNGSYEGLYCMTEKMDRKQLKLKKFKSASESLSGKNEIHGLLYKSNQWCYEVLMGHEQNSSDFPGYLPRDYSNTMGVEKWTEYEFKYPDYEDEAVEWGPLYRAVRFVACTEGDDFDREVSTHFDYPLLKDYYLFIELLLATDNHGKNMYFYVYDQNAPEGEKFGVAPWDLDGTWGARWDGSIYLTYPDQDYNEFLWRNEHGQHTLYHKLEQSKNIDWHGELAERYAELRREYFNADRIAERFADYTDLFVDSRADLREQQRWSDIHYGITTDVDYIKQWVRQRIDFLDTQYGFDPVASSVNEAVAESRFNVVGGVNEIGITAGTDCTVTIYNLSGRLVRTQSVPRGFTVVEDIPSGIYLVNGLKVIVK